MTGYLLGKIIPMIPNDAMEFTIAPRATVNHGRLLPQGFRMHNRLVVTYDITSYSEMITEILCADVLKAVQYCKQISGSAQKGTICR